MKPSFLFLSISILAFFVQSCQTVVDVELPEPENKLVVNCLFAQDSTFYFQISHTATILDPDSIEIIKDASIKLTSSDGEEETLTELGTYYLQFEEKQYYKSNMRATSGITYTIEVSHPDYKTVIAQAEVPEGITIQGIDTSTIVDNGYEVYRLDITFEDPIGTNYYDVKLHYATVSPIYDEQGNIIAYAPMVTPVYYYPANENLLTGNAGTAFSDVFFEGQRFKLNLNVDKYYFENSFFGDTTSQSFPGILLIELRTISEDYFLYEQSLNKYFVAEGDPFAQPVQVTTNIDGGLGIFAGYGVSIDTFTIKN